MLKTREMQILSHFRNNARISLTQLSRKTKIPVSTLFDKLKEYETSSLIKKHTTIIDFKKAGYSVRLQVLVMANKERRTETQEFLIKHPRVNTVFRINNGFDFLAEGIFKDLEELDEFTRKLEEHEPTEKREFFVMEDIKREEFMTYKENLGVTQ